MAEKINNTLATEPTEEFMLFIKKTRIIVCRYKKKNQEEDLEKELETELFYLDPINKKITYHKTTEGQNKIQIVLENQIRIGNKKEPLNPRVRNKIKEIELKKSGKKKPIKHEGQGSPKQQNNLTLIVSFVEIFQNNIHPADSDVTRGLF